jgi:DNA-binding beta-propeller fold protein YncE
VGADRSKSFCICDASDPEALRIAARLAKLPVDRITEVRVLDSYSARWSFPQSEEGIMRKWLTLSTTVFLAGGCADAPLTAPVREFSRSLTGGAGEIWVTAQDASQIRIVHGFGSIETVPLPAGSAPHMVNFSPSGAYAYVANVGNGALVILRVADRQVVKTLPLGVPGFGDTGTHQARPTPDGTVVLVAQIPSRTLIKVAADEAGENWGVVGTLTLPARPICTAYRADGARAYVSMSPSGIAIVDVASLSLLGTITTDGDPQCGLLQSRDGRTIYVDDNGGMGNFYVLDTVTDSLTNLGYVLGAADLHGFGVNSQETLAFAAARGSESLKVLDLQAPGSAAATIPLDPTPGPGNDRPDIVAVRGNNVYVTLRTSGKLAVVNGMQGTVKYIDIAPASANAVHGLAIRP